MLLTGDDVSIILGLQVSTSISPLAEDLCGAAQLVASLGKLCRD